MLKGQTNRNFRFLNIEKTFVELFEKNTVFGIYILKLYKRTCFKKYMTFLFNLEHKEKSRDHKSSHRSNKEKERDKEKEEERR